MKDESAISSRLARNDVGESAFIPHSSFIPHPSSFMEHSRTYPLADFRLECAILNNGKVLRARTAAWPVCVIVASFVVRVFLIFRYRFDWDESQHMHVAWGWAHGLMQYR